MAGGAFDKKKLRKAWAHVAAESGQRATAFAVVERGRFVAANAALTELLGLDPVGLAWDEAFQSPFPRDGAGVAVPTARPSLDVWAATTEGSTALAFAEGATTPAPAERTDTGAEWGRLALDLARCDSATEIDAVCRAWAGNLVGPRGFVAVPSTVEGEVVVRCVWPVGEPAPTTLAFDHGTCDAIRTGEVSATCRHSQGLVCTPVFVQGRLACVLGAPVAGEASELFAKLVGEALARLS